MAQKTFHIIAEVAAQGEAKWEHTGTLLEVLGVAAKHVTEPANAGLAPMALGYLEEHMNGLEVGGRLAYNWTCSVLNCIVVRKS